MPLVRCAICRPSRSDQTTTRQTTSTRRALVPKSSNGVSAPIDAVVIAGHQPEWLGDTEIKEREAAMLGREKALLKQILVPPFSSSASWP